MGRALSAICYLNDDYEGGEIEFPEFKVKIKPEAGMLILFPSNFAYKHTAYPVTKGTKYALVTWIHDRPLS
jgi:predicted 2-oxoglutarate/Fe(II)-dependent dioxygenase YbiX